MSISKNAALAACIVAFGWSAASRAQTITPTNIEVTASGPLLVSGGPAGRCTYHFAGAAKAGRITFDHITRDGGPGCDNPNDMRIGKLTLVPQSSGVMMAMVYLTSLDPLNAQALNFQVGWDNASSAATFGVPVDPHAHYWVTGGIVTVRPSIYVQ
ncbi:hypothetical protein Bsp3421_002980 [Burkholderia sp. FERM BP-3421]|jgi:hypothetical protein|uniref:hypothetical protein n=1 Tax=Burkholderia sp. FERM BP-3421 TaxID=1494466 RepID=UPI002360485B|nr:hypothetical protein [Burkholderia sp. FERM BP-3421]WDD92940.1 hypothetical protein Bsp3421_002980 [Burkholderia sp. FERM BP-3421]